MRKSIKTDIRIAMVILFENIIPIIEANTSQNQKCH